MNIAAIENNLCTHSQARYYKFFYNSGSQPQDKGLEHLYLFPINITAKARINLMSKETAEPSN